MKRRIYLVSIIVGLLGCIWLVYRMAAPLQKQDHRSLFSWSSQQLSGTGRDALFASMEAMEMNVLYQSFPCDAEKAMVEDFLKAAAEQNISVWLLTGDPSWGLDPTGSAMIGEIGRTAEYQRELPEPIRFRGVMMDCEPYLTPQWEHAPEEVMDSWCSALAAAREKAHSEGLLLYVCIPYYLDSSGFSDYLQRMVQTGCDGLAIMNYYKKNEAAHVETEINMANAAGIPVVVIYELQAPGSEGLLEINTYYHDGLDAVKHSWDALCRQFDGASVSLALHEYHALREVAGFE